MDALDDLFREAAEVYENNKWLAYGKPMHRLREFGISVKEIDLQRKIDLLRVGCWWEGSTFASPLLNISGHHRAILLIGGMRI